MGMKVFVVDCLVGALIGAGLGGIVALATGETVLKWPINALIGMGVAGLFGGIFQLRQELPRFGSVSDRARVGGITGWLMLGLTLWEFHISGLIARYWFFEAPIAVYVLTIIAGLCGGLVGSFVNATISRLCRKSARPPSGSTCSQTLPFAAAAERNV
jgi:prepilin signal peptidase PulO-like enzyme (type II secretory pathway)